MAADWYILFDGRPLGPFTFTRLKSLTIEGQVTADTLVCQAGMQEWIPAKNLQGLFESGAMNTTPPPLPQVAAETMPVISVASSRTGRTRPRSRASQRTDCTVNVLLGCLGIAALLVGACCPVLRLPILGNASYFGFAKVVLEAGVRQENIDLLAAPILVAVAVATAAVAALARQRFWFWLPSFFASVAPLITLGRFFWTQNQIDKHFRNEGGPLAMGMGNLVGLEFGIAVVAIGAGLLVAAAVVPPAQRA
jgi:hypothetical protein